MTRKMTPQSTAHAERAVLVQVVHSNMDPDEAADSLLELERLSKTAGLTTVAQLTQKRAKPDGGTLVGSGKMEELKAIFAQTEANTLLVDNELSAIQAHNLRKILDVQVLDRTEVILEIFARRARTAQAKLQVQLASLEFQLTRIPVRASQQRFKGKANVRGPGESHLHLRNEPLRRRINVLRKKIKTVQKQQASHRNVKRQWPVVSLVGYTNAGKSTLLNTLARSEAYVDNKLFATLDTKTRKVWLSPTEQILMTDTVGFIRNLPHGLIASFKSTLDVASQADLLLVMVDATYSHVDDHIDICYQTLREIGAKDVPKRLILNKCDHGIENKGIHNLTIRYPDALCISAKTGYGLDRLKNAITNTLKKHSDLWCLPPAIDPMPKNEDPA